MAKDKDEDDRRKFEEARRALGLGDELEQPKQAKDKPSLRVVEPKVVPFVEPWRSAEWLPTGENVVAEVKRLYGGDFCNTEAEPMRWKDEP